MPIVPAGTNHSAQVKAFVEQGRGLSLSALIRFFFPDQNLDLLRQKTADRGAPPCGQDFRFSDGLSARK
jgi:hypothetical protein